MLNEIDLSRTDLNLLVLFEVVLGECHVGRAAERLNLSPSAVSHGLGRLRRLLNDPLFLRTPKGVVPTARALALAEPIAEALARVRGIVATAAPFDPATSARRFRIGAPDGVSGVFLPPLLALARKRAPQIDISLRQVLPPQGGRTTVRAFEPALAEIEAREVDVAVLPYEDVPARFVAETLYQEDFVIAMRRGHAFAAKPTLARYCEMRHAVVSMTGDPEGFVDRALTEQGHARRVALTVPNFNMALAIVAETDLLCALPRRFAAMHAPRAGVVWVEAPMVLPRFQTRAVASRAAMRDAGVAWLFALLREVAGAAGAKPRRRASAAS